MGVSVVRDFNNPNFKGGTLGAKNYQDIGLSVNIALFGSNNTKFSSTFEIFARGITNQPPNFKVLFDMVSSKLGFNRTWEDFQPLFDKYQRNFGRLYQIFIHPDHADQMAYMSVAGGHPFLIPTEDGRESDKPTQTISLLRTNPAGFQNGVNQKKIVSVSMDTSSKPQEKVAQLENVQARLFLKPELFHDPQKVQIKIYDNRPHNAKQEQSFWDELEAMVTEDLTRWIFNKKKMPEGTIVLEQLPLEQMAKYVYRGQAGISYVQQDPIQQKMLELLKLLQTSNVADVQSFIESNPAYPIDTPLKHVDYYNPEYSFEMSPLLFVAAKIDDNKEELLMLLVKAGANISAINDEGQDVLDLVIQFEMENFGLFLINQPSLNLLHRDKNGNSYLHYASRSKTKSFLLSLVDKGADVTVKNNDEDTPLHLAANNDLNNADLVAILLKNEEPLLTENKQGKTPLQISAENGKLEFSGNIRSYQHLQKQIIPQIISQGLSSIKFDLTNQINNIRDLLGIPDIAKAIRMVTFVGGEISAIIDICVKLPNLTSLTITGTRIYDKGAKVIATHLPYLTHLNLANNGINCEGTKAIATHLSYLTHLNLAKNSINAAGAKAIATHLPNLTYLNLRGNYLNNTDIQPILDSSSIYMLTYLNLGGCKMTNEQVQAVAPKMIRLTYLNLKNSDISYKGMEAIAAHMTNLTYLNLRGVPSYHQGALTIATNLPHLKILKLTANSIGNVGVRYIATNLPHLTHLVLINNRIGDLGVQTIITHITDLIYLNLRCNNISDVGAKNILKSPHLGHITSLNLVGNCISDAMKSALQKRLGNRLII